MIRAICKFGANHLTKKHECLCNLSIDANDRIVIHEIINENSKKQECEFIDDELEDLGTNITSKPQNIKPLPDYQGDFIDEEEEQI